MPSSFFIPSPPSLNNLPSGASIESQDLLARFRLLWEQEEQAVQQLSEKEGAVFKIPRLTTPEWITTVEAISQSLSTI